MQNKKKKIINNKSKFHSFPLGRLGWEKLKKMKTGTKLLLFVGIPLVLIGGGVGIHFYRKNKKEKKLSNARETAEYNKVTEDQFAELVKAAQSSTISNIFKGASTPKLDELYKKATTNLTAFEVASLTAFYKLGYNHEGFDKNQFTNYNEKLLN